MRMSRLCLYDHFKHVDYSIGENNSSNHSAQVLMFSRKTYEEHVMDHGVIYGEFIP
jgi:hypothetical protein